MGETERDFWREGARPLQTLLIISLEFRVSFSSGGAGVVCRTYVQYNRCSGRCITLQDFRKQTVRFRKENRIKSKK
jgi:hypothetical protein